VPAIGDDDEGRVVTLCQPEPDYAVSVAIAIRGFLGQGAPLPTPANLRNAIFTGPTGRDGAIEGATTFPAGGYSIWRGPHAGHNFHAMFDHGPLGYLSIAAHGHADALSLWLALDGRPVLVDPGTYRYQGGGAWRDWFRSTRAHNTLTVGGVSQSISAGAFNWSHKAEARRDSSAEHPWAVTASHDGYHGRFGVRHQRSVSLTEAGMSIADALVGATSPLAAELTFQLAADLRARIDGNTVAVSRGDQPVLSLILPSAAIRIVNAGDATEGGWVSDRFGHKEPADRVVWSGEVGAAGVLTTVLFAHSGE
jgi:hypothetical protein